MVKVDYMGRRNVHPAAQAVAAVAAAPAGDRAGRAGRPVASPAADGHVARKVGMVDLHVETGEEKAAAHRVAAGSADAALAPMAVLFEMIEWLISTLPPAA